MTLKDFVDRQRLDMGLPVTKYLRYLAQQTGLGYGTIYYVYKGAKVNSYEKAEVISDFTNGIVSVSELCQGSL